MSYLSSIFKILIINALLHINLCVTDYGCHPCFLTRKLCSVLLKLNCYFLYDKESLCPITFGSTYVMFHVCKKSQWQLFHVVKSSKLQIKGGCYSVLIHKGKGAVCAVVIICSFDDLWKWMHTRNLRSWLLKLYNDGLL